MHTMPCDTPTLPQILYQRVQAIFHATMTLMSSIAGGYVTTKLLRRHQHLLEARSAWVQKVSTHHKLMAVPVATSAEVGQPGLQIIEIVSHHDGTIIEDLEIDLRQLTMRVGPHMLVGHHRHQLSDDQDGPGLFRIACRHARLTRFLHVRLPTPTTMRILARMTLDPAMDSLVTIANATTVHQ